MVRLLRVAILENQKPVSERERWKGGQPPYSLFLRETLRVERLHCS